MKSKLRLLTGALPALIFSCVAGFPAFAATLPAPVPNAIISAASSWGSATDSWAGYTGSLAVWVPAAVSNGWTLTFQSAGLGQQVQASSFWNANASYNASTHTFTLTSPSWESAVAANSALSIGFNASGVLNPTVDLANCTFNGQPCVISVLSAQASQQTIANLEAGQAAGSGSSSSSSSNGSSTGSGSGSSTSSGSGSATTATPALQVLFSINNTWSGGYSGTVAVQNMSSGSLPSGAGGWQAILKFPDSATAHNVFQSGPWNFQVNIAADGTTTLTPASWAAALPAGGVTSSGFNGVTPADLQTAASGSTYETVVFASSVAAAAGGSSSSGSSSGSGSSSSGSSSGSGSSSSGSSGSTTPAGTGTASGLLFSPYKDIGTSLNWNTNVMSTAITGTLTPILNVIPAKLPAVTWAFATGECGSENWAGVAADALAQANVQAFANANVNYVVSTGGAAGAFTCSSAAGMTTFINRYASKNLVGIDFDIEAGQTQAQINSLVQQVAAVQSAYPKLRFSFTIATLASSNGTAASNPYGDLNVTGYYVMQAIQQYAVTNYTINLMAMDFGAPGSSVCVVSNGVCDMGLSAIQAAKNLNAKYGTPYSKIELTPMIGVNDVSSEIFSLANVDSMTQWAISNQLAGLHFWSLDRDTPCSQSTASSTCSSVPSVSTLGYTNRFITDLGL
ncbi:cellulose-binding protein [Candidatus Methylospira mobilis]|uniref:Cellulose-binding protein n=1 Tax=Candidatus Methylospira mobilis TaxID=1808979 RepID=A0A5Q0BH40_9GAMM|nr:cellulose binding domain-containing protein [Candidatus Methylospira mobilis]QFY43185.1 cellulose-binding protein [Candidatus Methylospira mobilis]